MDKKANYEKIIKNAKKVKKILEKSKMRPEILQSMNFIIKNYTLDDEINTWLYRYCDEKNIHFQPLYDTIYPPVKITTFDRIYLELVKKRIENWNVENERLTEYWQYDYSICVNKDKGRYNREYKGCWNWYYYLLLDHETAMFYEKD